MTYPLMVIYNGTSTNGHLLIAATSLIRTLNVGPDCICSGGHLSISYSGQAMC